jgi:hypothetical protein
MAALFYFLEAAQSDERGIFCEAAWQPARQEKLIISQNLQNEVLANFEVDWYMH